MNFFFILYRQLIEILLLEFPCSSLPIVFRKLQNADSGIQQIPPLEYMARIASNLKLTFTFIWYALRLLFLTLEFNWIGKHSLSWMSANQMWNGRLNNLGSHYKQCLALNSGFETTLIKISMCKISASEVMLFQASSKSKQAQPVYFWATWKYFWSNIWTFDLKLMRTNNLWADFLDHSCLAFKELIFLALVGVVWDNSDCDHFQGAQYPLWK